MKSIRLFIGVIALLFAFAAAYAAKVSPDPLETAVIKEGPQGNHCVKESISICDGGNRTCRLGEEQDEETVFEYEDDSDCGAALTME